MSSNFLEIEDVTFTASKKNKVNNVSFGIKKEGEIVCLLGTFRHWQNNDT
jgi:iron(III) transport system ATP-binding protein